MASSSWHSCNVLRTSAEGRNLWQFHAKNGAWELSGDFKALPSEALPARVTAKDWQTLWQAKLNIAWLPADRVGLRILHLPACEHAELRSMVELQVEKLSPMPLNQSVWTMEVLPHPDPGTQTVLLAVVERRVVEDFLAGLEREGFFADRLDWPQLHQLAAMKFDQDGASILIEPQGSKTGCLLVWSYGGIIQDVGWMAFQGGPDQAGVVAAHLRRTAWAGELQGWLTAKPAWRVIAPETALSPWVHALGKELGEEVSALPWPEPRRIAAQNADRAASGRSPSNLLPAEFTARYRQQFIDRIWMRVMGGVLSACVIGTIGYFGALEFRKHQFRTVDRESAGMSQNYTNALQLSAKIKVLQDQADLRFAALDSWRAVSELLPSELTLTSFDFSKGRVLTLYGTAPTDQQGKITEFNAALSKAGFDDLPLFSKVNPARIAPLSGAQSGTAQWSFDCEVRRPEGVE